MKNFSLALLFFCCLKNQSSYGQIFIVDKSRFFEDTAVINATIITDLSHLLKKRGKATGQYPANFSATLANGFSVNEPIFLELRGHMRKDYCYIPPLKIIFKNKKDSVLRSLGSLKLVSECKTSSTDEQYLLKEFLAYKIYNLLTDMSFRVRLLNLTLADSVKNKTLNEHAFLIEDIKDLAERNNCDDLKNAKVNTEATDRRQMTIVAIFEYMIGNTDWGVPVQHNVKLILSKIDSLNHPYAVPYDFDYAGLVNTDYAVPDEKLGIQSVRDRVYRGFPRSTQEINDILNIFKKQKDNIYSLINNFDLLTSASKKDIIHYLDGFFDLINSPEQVNNTFHRNARTE